MLNSPPPPLLEMNESINTTIEEALHNFVPILSTFRIRLTFPISSGYSTKAN